MSRDRSLSKSSVESLQKLQRTSFNQDHRQSARKEPRDSSSKKRKETVLTESKQSKQIRNHAQTISVTFDKRSSSMRPGSSLLKTTKNKNSTTKAKSYTQNNFEALVKALKLN